MAAESWGKKSESGFNPLSLLPLAGNLITGLGAGYIQNSELDFEKQKEEERKREADRSFYQNNETTARTLGFKGLDALAGLRSEAMANHRMQIVRDGVLSGGI